MKKNRTRRIALALAFILTAGMLVTGTLAWQSVSQQALNQAIGIPGGAGGRLHDDFEDIGENFGARQWSAGLTANKDVYVENFDQQSIFVRIRLLEYMEIGQGASLHPGDPGFLERDAAPLLPGAVRTQVDTWRPRLPSMHTQTDPIVSYWTWAMGGQKYFMPTFNRDSVSRESDIKGAAIDPQSLSPGEVQNATHPGQSHAHPPGAGRANFWNAGDTHEAPLKYWDESLNGGQGGHAMTTYSVTHTARPTLNARVMTMEQWLTEENAQPGHFWVWDEDGWFYWAAPLAGGDATGLLLSAITLRADPTDQWYYAIHIDAEMANARELEDAWATPTDDARDLMNVIVGGTLSPPITPPEETLGVWLWRGRPENPHTQAARLRYLEFAAQQGVTEIYLAAGFTTAWHNEAETREFIREASARDISVYYLDGDAYWVTNHYRLFNRLEAFEAYQARVPANERFAGIHLNIEPHQLNAWRGGDPEERAALLQSYIDLKVAATDRFGPMDWSVPFFWRGGEGAHLSPPQPAYNIVNHRGVMRPLYQASILEARRIVVMSYRTSAVGPNSMQSISQHYIDFAREHNRPLILSALVEPGGETAPIYFRDLGHARMMAELETLRQAVDLPGFGVAVHELHGWYNMWAREFAPEEVAE